jgi:NAD-dependent deacetylase
MAHHENDPTITVLTGAGISTGAGIPDFRGPDGVWTTHPEQAELLEIGPYVADPQVRVAGWRMWRDHPAWAARPSAAHRALVDLQRAGLLRGLLTQNFDGLHQASGSTEVVELHGSLTTTSCLACRWRTETSTVLAGLDADPDPHCPRCGGVLKPDIVYFGEMLDDDALGGAVAAAQDAEVFIAIGSTLSVQPVASLAGLAVEYGAELIVVNDAPTMYDGLAARILRDPIEVAVPALVAELIDAHR